MQDIINGRIGPGKAIQDARHKVSPGAFPNTAIEILDDDDEDDILEEQTTSPLTPDRIAKDRTMNWVRSPERGLSRECPSSATRKARRHRSSSEAFNETFGRSQDILEVSSSVATVAPVPRADRHREGRKDNTATRHRGERNASSPDQISNTLANDQSSYRVVVRTRSGYPYDGQEQISSPPSARTYDLELGPLSSPTSNHLAEVPRSRPLPDDYYDSILDAEDGPSGSYKQPLIPNELLSGFHPVPASSPVQQGSSPRGERLASASMSSPRRSPGLERNLVLTNDQRRGPTDQPDQPVPRRRPMPRQPQPRVNQIRPIVVEDPPIQSIGSDVSSSIMVLPVDPERKDIIAQWTQEVEPIETVVISPTGTPEPPPVRQGVTLNSRPEKKDDGGEKRKRAATPNPDRPMPKKRKVPTVAIPPVEDFPMSMPSTSFMSRGRAEKGDVDAMLSTQAKAMMAGSHLDEEVEETASESGLDCIEVLQVEQAKTPQLQLRGKQATEYC